MAEPLDLDSIEADMRTCATCGHESHDEANNVPANSGQCFVLYCHCDEDTPLAPLTKDTALALVARLRAAEQVVEAARAESLRGCYQPDTAIGDLGGHLVEVDCGHCDGCTLADALAAYGQPTATADAEGAADGK